MAITRAVTALLHPELSIRMHKGQSGKIAVFGGSKSYTGAPYFAGITAMKLGIDLVTIWCSVEAGIPIKAYTPDLMVRPVMVPGDGKYAPRAQSERERIERGIQEEINTYITKMTAVVIGPGLSLDEWILEQARNVIQKCIDEKIPFVVDGDGLMIINKNKQLLKTAKVVVLTPNAMEFRRLWDAYIDEEAPPMSLHIDDTVRKILDNKESEGGVIPVDSCIAKDTARLAQAIGSCNGNVIICRKGVIDVLSNGKQAVYCSSAGGMRRTGGQGDVTAGGMGTYIAWVSMLYQNASNDQQQNERAQKLLRAIGELDPYLVAGFAACLLTRHCSRHAFIQKKTIDADIRYNRHHG